MVIVHSGTLKNTGRLQMNNCPNKALVRTQTTLRFVSAAQFGRYMRQGFR